MHFLWKGPHPRREAHKKYSIEDEKKVHTFFITRLASWFLAGTFAINIWWGLVKLEKLTNRKSLYTSITWWLPWCGSSTIVPSAKNKNGELQKCEWQYIHVCVPVPWFHEFLQWLLFMPQKNRNRVMPGRVEWLEKSTWGNKREWKEMIKNK